MPDFEDGLRTGTKLEVRNGLQSVRTIPEVNMVSPLGPAMTPGIVWGPNRCTVEILRRGPYSPKLLRIRLKYNKKFILIMLRTVVVTYNYYYAYNFLLLCNSNRSV